MKLLPQYDIDFVLLYIITVYYIIDILIFMEQIIKTITSDDGSKQSRKLLI